MASDGLWDLIDDAEIIALIEKLKDGNTLMPEALSETLAQDITLKWKGSPALTPAFKQYLGSPNLKEAQHEIQGNTASFDNGLQVKTKVDDVTIVVILHKKTTLDKGLGTSGSP